MPGTNSVSPLTGVGLVPLGTMYPGGSFQIVSGTIATATVITTLAPHGLSTGDTIFWTASTTSNPALTVTPRQVVTVLSPTTFSIPVNCSAGATAGTYDLAVMSIPVTAVGVPATVTMGSRHGLHVGDTVTLVATGAVAAVGGAMDAALTITAVPTPNSFVVGAFTNVTTPSSTTAGHGTKTTYNSDVWDSLNVSNRVGLVISPVVNTGTPSTKMDIQGSLDNVNWFNLPYAIITAPQTLVVAQLTVTSATVVNYKIAAPGEANYFPYRYLRLHFSTSADILVTATLTALG